VLVISIFILIILPVLPWLFEKKNKLKDKDELLEIIRNNVVPRINLALEVLQNEIEKKFSLKGKVRISLWIPVKKKFFTWNLQMVCKTENIPDKELRASFELDEGVIGYTYLKNKRKYSLEFIDVSNLNDLPQSYVDLKSDNGLLINHDFKIVLAIAAFQESSIIGLLAIDTDNTMDSSQMNDADLHSMALDWIVEFSGVVKLLWRMKNNV
jgi:hypothetical protein